MPQNGHGGGVGISSKNFIKKFCYLSSNFNGSVRRAQMHILQGYYIDNIN